MNWEAYLGSGRSFSCGSACKDAFRKTIEQSRNALAFGEHQYFARKLKQKHAWRAWPDFRESCAYVDIETSGGNDITVVGIYDGSRFTALVKDDNLGNFPDVISHYSTVVTFFGTGFDLPVLQKQFKNFQFDQIHIDLCPLLRSLGYRGGLKRIEKEFGIQRDPAIDGLTGYDAVKLWRRHRALGDDRALETLIEYNRADVVNLEALMIKAYDKMRQATLAFAEEQWAP
ncbi:MAG TPA: ribonuclease H-like domain-containing protein [Fimbriimonas sp.]|nr:ribonuclease H-like domain-containing protein [Fimbriimonas sp.]